MRLRLTPPDCALPSPARPPRRPARRALLSVRARPPGGAGARSSRPSVRVHLRSTSPACAARRREGVSQRLLLRGLAPRRSASASPASTFQFPPALNSRTPAASGRGSVPAYGQPGARRATCVPARHPSGLGPPGPAVAPQGSHSQGCLFCILLQPADGGLPSLPLLPPLSSAPQTGHLQVGHAVDTPPTGFAAGAVGRGRLREQRPPRWRTRAQAPRNSRQLGPAVGCPGSALCPGPARAAGVRPGRRRRSGWRGGAARAGAFPEMHQEAATAAGTDPGPLPAPPPGALCAARSVRPWEPRNNRCSSGFRAREANSFFYAPSLDSDSYDRLATPAK
ncbi:transcription initiation factor TFIID subunit 4-like [Ailuropoda melanoleuca]|uniref:transcription initiation factor TFIID subunit 4-like n=1 Tax=Ailuropoda melanoleuca TaxID=9646 RepID=UPI001493FD42|nr:transcription initiation factor TFIID subunit 4-like [Ailuropoda melanoleuca]